jgi:hypothetical protein
LPTLEEDLKGFGEDFPPSLQARQLLRSFYEVTKNKATARSALAAATDLA